VAKFFLEENKKFYYVSLNKRMDYKQNFTMIDHLPEVSINQGWSEGRPNGTNMSNIKPGRFKGHEMLPPSEADRFKKFIRNEHEVPNESGMVATSGGDFFGGAGGDQNIPDDYFNNSVVQYSNTKYQGINKKNKIKYSCGKISQHIETCKYCTRLYSSDKNIYILFIIFLLAICFLLFKKILSV